MANFGSFAGGFAQGFSPFVQQLPGIVAGKQDRDLRERQLSETIRQHKREEFQKWVQTRKEGLAQITEADPDLAPAFIDQALKEYEEMQGTKLPDIFKKMMKEDPTGTLSKLEGGDPDQIQQVLSSNAAFMNFLPGLVAAQKAQEARTVEREEPVLRGQAAEKFPGFTSAFYDAIAADAVYQNLLSAGAPQARIDKALIRVEKTRETLDKAMPDSVKQVLARSGIDLRSASMTDVQQALQEGEERGISLTQREEEAKAFGKATGEDRGFVSPLGRQAAQLRVDEAGFVSQAQKFGQIMAEITPQGRQLLAQQLTTDLQKQAFEKDYTAATKIEEGAPDLVKQKQAVVNLRNALAQTGPGGSIKGEAKRRLAIALGGIIPSERLAAYETIDPIIMELALASARTLAPVTALDLQKLIELPPNVRHSEEGRERILNAMKTAIDKNLELAGLASDWKGQVANGQYQGNAWSTRYGAWVNEWKNPEPSNVSERKGGGQSALPTRSDDPISLTMLGIRSLPPASRALSSAVAFVESNHNMDAVGKAGEVSAWQIKPSTAKDPGLPGVRPLNDAELKDPVATANFAREYIMALTREFNGNLRLGLAAYNVGLGNVREYIEGGWNDKKVAAAYDKGLTYADKVIAAMQGNTPPEGTALERRRGLARQAGRIGIEMGLTAMGGKGASLALEKATGRALPDIFLGRGARLGAETAGAVGGSALASATIDPIKEAELEAATAGIFTAVSGPFGSLVRNLVGPKGLTEGGKAITRLLTMRGREDLVLPGSVLHNKFVRNMQGMGEEAFADDVVAKKASVQQEFKLQGDLYAAEMIALKAERDTYFQMAHETMGNLRVNMRPTKRFIQQTMKEVDAGRTTLEPETIAQFKRIFEGKNEISVLQLDQLRQQMWGEWKNQVKQGNYGSATKASRQLGQLADYLDEMVDKSLDGFPVEKQYYQLGKAAAMEGMQGDKAAWILKESAKNSPEGIPDGKKVLQWLNESKHAPVKFAPAQEANLRELAQALIATQEKPGTFRVVARGMEIVGLSGVAVAAGTGIATGSLDPVTTAAASSSAIIGLLPSTLSKLLASKTATKLLTKALIEKPGSEQAWRAGMQLHALMQQEGWLIEE